MSRHSVKKTLARNKTPVLYFYFFPMLCLLLWLGNAVFYYGGLQVNGYYMIHYLYTYKHGFVARGFIGEMLSLLFDSVNDTVLQGTNILFAVMLVIATSLCIGKTLSKLQTDKTVFVFAAITVILICVSPPAFRTYFYDAKLDKLLWALTLFGVLATDNKYSIWLVPILCIIATLSNPVFVFCSMILIAIVLLQKLFDSHYAKRNIVLCAATYLPIIAVCAYGYFSLQKLGFSSPEELVNFYYSRYTGSTIIPYDRFYNEWLFDYFESSRTVLKLVFETYFIQWANGIFFVFDTLFIALPCYAGLTWFWIKTIRTETNKFQKFIYFLCAVSPVVTIIPNLLSWEGSKYFGNNILVQLCLILFFLSRKNPAITATVKNSVQFFKEHLIHTAAIAIYLSFIILV